MTERPILFSAPMVRAILEGRKTQTRRVVKWPDWALPERDGPRLATAELRAIAYFEEGRPKWRLSCPYGQPGDRLWVRETWGLRAFHDITDWSRDSVRGVRGDEVQAAWRVEYATDWNGLDPANVGAFWRPSIFMPRWASRITLEVTGVRVERLRSIIEADAKAEGAVFVDHGKRCFHADWNGDGPCPHEKTHQQKPGWHMDPAEAAKGDDHCLHSAASAFGNLWIDINGQQSWDDNPWVWVVSFKRVESKREAA